MRVRIIVLDYVSENWSYHPIYLCFYQILCFVVLLVLFSSFSGSMVWMLPTFTVLAKAWMQRWP